MLIISDRWMEKVCMRLLKYMQDTFLKFDTTLNDEPVLGNINESVSLHTIGVSNIDRLCAMWIKCLPLLRGNPIPCMRTEYTEVGHFQFEGTPSLIGGLILDRYMRRSILVVGCTIKCFNPSSMWK
jgi:hypothetical protein